MAERMTSAAVLTVLAGGVCAQSLYERPRQGPDATVENIRETREEVPVEAGGPPTLDEVGLFVVRAEPPVEFAAEDLITIIISERTEVEREQTLETDKSYNIEAGVTAIPDFAQLVELRLAQGDSLANIAAEYAASFSGEGEYERDDRVTARVTARVVEVKPNGVLLLEARTTITTDEEEQVITLSGYCRSEDVTLLNTVQSNQMYNLQLDMQNEGTLDDSAKKGVIPRVLETIFNF